MSIKQIALNNRLPVASTTTWLHSCRHSRAGQLLPACMRHTARPVPFVQVRREITRRPFQGPFEGPAKGPSQGPAKVPSGPAAFCLFSLHTGGFQAVAFLRELYVCSGAPVSRQPSTLFLTVRILVAARVVAARRSLSLSARLVVPAGGSFAVSFGAVAAKGSAA